MSRQPPPHHKEVRDSWLLVRGTVAGLAANPGGRAAPGGATETRPLARSSLASQLAQARVAAHITPAELARLAALPLGDIIAIEDGSTRFPPSRTRQSLSDVLGVNLVS